MQHHRPDYLPLLEKTYLFEGLDAAALQEVADAAHLRRVRDGGHFFHEAEPATVLYVLTEGRVKFTQVTAEGQQVLVRAIGPGETFGAVAALGNTGYAATAEANGPCAALGWPTAIIGGLMEKHPRIALNALRFLAGRVEEFQSRYRELATERVERRIARTLLRLARQIGRHEDSGEGILIDLPLSRQDIAEMTGTTLYTASRVLSGWEAQGFVRSGRERVTIVHPGELERLVGEPPGG